MSIVAFVQILISTSLLLYTVTVRDAYGKDFYQLFRDFVVKYNKSYEPGTTEYDNRAAIFKESLKRIELLNKGVYNKDTALYGINEYSDMTPEEFKNYKHMRSFRSTEKQQQRNHKLLLQSASFFNSIPKHIDWREKKVITSVRNQDQCGACWAFSTVETVEAMYALKTGILVNWSVQQLIDCAPSPNQGCDGGDTCMAIEWLYQDKINLVMDKDYPFADDSGLCKIRRSSNTVRVADNFTCSNFIGEEELMLYQLAFHGPIIAAVDASGWQDYLGGIVQFHCGVDRNHAVQIVGYDLTGETPFYIVRNSWGTEFGINGYLYIAIGNNVCGIAEEVSALDVL